MISALPAPALHIGSRGRSLHDPGRHFFAGNGPVNGPSGSRPAIAPKSLNRRAPPLPCAAVDFPPSSPLRDPRAGRLFRGKDAHAGHRSTQVPRLSFLQPCRYQHGSTRASVAWKAFTSIRSLSVASPRRDRSQNLAADLSRPAMTSMRALRWARKPSPLSTISAALVLLASPARGAQQVCQRRAAAVQVAPSRPAGDPAIVDGDTRATRKGMLPAGLALRRRRRTAPSPTRMSMCWRPTCARQATASIWRWPRWWRGSSGLRPTTFIAAPSASGGGKTGCALAIAAVIACWPSSAAASVLAIPSAEADAQRDRGAGR